jgi:hypothetical protein
LIIAVQACDSDAHRLSGPYPGGIVVATLNVTGQRELSRPSWPLRFDGSNVVELRPDTAAMLTMDATEHTFVFDGRYPPHNLLGEAEPPVEWCVIQGEKTRTVRVSPDAPTRLDYSIDCPELKGFGTFNVSFTALGPAAPSRLVVSMNRVTGESYRAATTLARGEVKSVTVPAGVYRVSIDDQHCQGFGIPVLRPWEDFLIRDRWSPVVAIVLNC